MTKKFVRSQSIVDLLALLETEIAIQCNSRREAHVRAAAKRAEQFKAEIVRRCNAAQAQAVPGKGL